VSLTIEPIYNAVASELGWDPYLELRPPFDLAAVVAASYARPRPDPPAASSTHPPASLAPGSGSAPRRKPPAPKKKPTPRRKVNQAKAPKATTSKVNDA
jgi:hypothetical protein